MKEKFEPKSPKEAEKEILKIYASFFKKTIQGGITK